MEYVFSSISIRMSKGEKQEDLTSSQAKSDIPLIAEGGRENATDLLNVPVSSEEDLTLGKSFSQGMLYSDIENFTLNFTEGFFTAGGDNEDTLENPLFKDFSEKDPGRQDTEVGEDLKITEDDMIVIGDPFELDTRGSITSASLEISTTFIDIGSTGSLAVIFHDTSGLENLLGDTSITHAASVHDAVSALEAHEAFHGALILQGHTTAEIGSFSDLANLGLLDLHQDASTVTV